MPAIEVNHVTKEFRLGTIENFRDTLTNLYARLRGRPGEERAQFKALDDIDFRIQPGEVVGVIGHNGAGKSTLLKLLARVSQPTSGSVKVVGRVAPLIEVGAGFVSEFTGRENIYLNGTILGMTKAEIDSKFDEIVEFAEIGEFIDTPMKRYSSGMQVRLGFAVATSVEADVLLVDEVLAVGDLAFQRKCFERMENLLRGSGRTILLVSHNIRQVERLCSRAILLSHGRVIMDDVPAVVCDEFYRQSNEKVREGIMSRGRSLHRVKSSGEATFIDASVVDRSGAPLQGIVTGQELRVRIRFSLSEDLVQPEIIVGTHTTDFIYLTTGSTASLQNRPDLKVGEHEVTYVIPSFPLVPGTYAVRFSLLDKNGRFVFRGETLTVFTVRPRPESVGAMEVKGRLVDAPCQWELDGRQLELQPRTVERPRASAAVG